MSSTLDTLSRHTSIVQQWTTDIAATSYPAELDAIFPVEKMTRAQREITSWPGYAPTALRSLDKVATHAGVGSVLYKDESTRFSLGSFKALGGAYAVMRYLADTLAAKTGENISIESIRNGDWREQAAKLTVASATDGNHGRSVAWGAQLAGCQCKIYIHAEVSEGRERAMAELGADVIRIDGDYDESVRECASASSNNGWQVISDTSYEGYMDVPGNVMAGYTTMVSEIAAELSEPPTHVIIQAGVGGLAAAVTAALWAEYGENMPKLVIVESEFSACVQQSLQTQQATSVPISEETIMAGLSCGEISILAWEILSRSVSAAVSITDAAVGPAMQVMANGLANDEHIEAGECAVPGIIALLGCMNDPSLRVHLSLDAQSRVLVFGCEGATDRAVYDEVMSAQYS